MAHFHPGNILDVDNDSWEARHWCEGDRMLCVCEPAGTRPAFPHPTQHIWALCLEYLFFPSESLLSVPVALSWPRWWQGIGGCCQHLLLPCCEQSLGAGKGNFKRIFSAVSELIKVRFFGVLAESFGFSIKNGNV